MIPLQLFNTETRQLETVRPHDGTTVRFYTCGPTVYDFAHIGNFRTFVFEDLLRRTLLFLGYKVKQVMNLTDVDDKTIRGALANGVSLDAFTATYKTAFFEDLKTLHIQPVEHYPAATDFIPQMIAMVQKLLDKKAAYKGSDGSVYFSIKNFPSYGKLSHLKLEDLQVGASERVSADEYAKESASDFVLWKAYDEARDGNIFWESPFGRGRPGWHLECSVMAQALLGETIDLHAGGVDLIFPHHENEIAQSECCSGKEFSKMWVHAEHLLVDGKKMSKSLGNFYTLRDLMARGYTGKVLRFMLLQTHYRTQLNFTMQGLEAAKAGLARINDFIIRLGECTETGAHNHIPDLIGEWKERFTKALSHDLNISEALAVVFEMISKVNALMEQNLLDVKEANQVLDFMRKLDEVLGVCSFSQNGVPQDIQQLVDARQVARKARDFAKADQLRHDLLEKGYVVEDTASGLRIKKVT